jgi:hypothetical protein
MTREEWPCSSKKGGEWVLGWDGGWKAPKLKAHREPGAGALAAPNPTVAAVLRRRRWTRVGEWRWARVVVKKEEKGGGRKGEWQRGSAHFKPSVAGGGGRGGGCRRWRHVASGEGGPPAWCRLRTARLGWPRPDSGGVAQSERGRRWLTGGPQLQCRCLNSPNRSNDSKIRNLILFKLWLVQRWPPRAPKIWNKI